LLFIVDEMLRQDRIKSLERIHDRRLALMLCFSNDPEKYNKLAEDEVQIFEDHINLILGQPEQKGDRRVRVAKALRASWHKAFAENKSEEEVQRDVDAVAEALRQQRLGAKR
jgi:hypothetical protein